MDPTLREDRRPAVDEEDVRDHRADDRGLQGVGFAAHLLRGQIEFLGGQARPTSVRWVDNMTVVADAPHPCTAHAFIDFMNSADSQAYLADELGLLPTRKSAYENEAVASNEVVSAFKDVVDAAVARPWIPEGGQFFAALDKMAVEVLVQGRDPKAALDDAAKTYKAEVVPDYSLQ